MSHTIQRVVFLGAPSTGKSTIAQRVAAHYDTAYVAEYGRDYWLAHQVDRRLTQAQLLHIAEAQIALEDEAMSHAHRYLIVDTNALTTWHFAIDYYGEALPELTALADDSKRRFAVVFVCDDDIPFEDTWERSGDVKRGEFQRFLLDQLHAREIHYHRLSGSVEARLQQVIAVLG